MKRFIVNVILIIICFLLQTTVFQWLALAHVVPNLLLIMVVSLAFMMGKNIGMITGIFVGLLVDTMYGDVIGGYALIYMYIGYMNGFAHKLFYIEDILLPLALITASDLVYNFLVYIFTYLLYNKLDIGYYFKRIMIPEMLYTLLVSVFIYKLLFIINKKLTEPKEEMGKIV